VRWRRREERGSCFGRGGMNESRRAWLCTLPPSFPPSLPRFLARYLASMSGVMRRDCTKKVSPPPWINTSAAA